MSVLPAPPVRQKRSSLHFEASLRKRRKVDHPPGSRSPAPHICPPKPLLTYSIPFKNPGLPLCFGTGDIGQLGLGPDILERSRPARWNNRSLSALKINETELETFVVQVCAGGMHTVLLTTHGRVITFGCNDEGALGRSVNNEQTSDVMENAMEEKSESAQATPYPITDETHPGFVPLPPGIKITMVSAGDSHTAALDSDGQVWIWGTFRGPSGPIGLTEDGEISFLPKRLLDVPTTSSHGQSNDGRHLSSHLTPGMRVVKIASGQDHLVCLTEEGRLYTMGSAEQGQLGRIAERFSKTGGRSGINSLLYPTECRVRGTVRFSDAWAGGFATFARCQATGAIYACGLNNYGQLGLKDPATQSAHNGGNGDEDDEGGSGHDEEHEGEASIDAALLISDRNEADKSEAALIARQGPLIQFMLTRARAFDPSRGWGQFAVSMHHTLALDKEGHIYAIGRSDYGRLGIGSALPQSGVSVSQPTRVRGLLDDRRCIWVGCGEACSFAVDDKGVAYSWGIANSQQLGHGSDEDGDRVEPGVVIGKQLKDRVVSMVDAGGQHTVLLAHASDTGTSDGKSGDVAMTTVPMDNEKCDSKGISEAPKQVELTKNPPTEISISVTQPEPPLKEDVVHDVQSEPSLNPPSGAVLPSARRNRRPSPCSVTLASGGMESTTGSTAGATINSSIHSSAVSDTSSVGSCGSTASTSSQLNSAKSTDGGGSSRCSSFTTFSVQSSLPVSSSMAEGDTHMPSSSSSIGGLMLGPQNASMLPGARSLPQAHRVTSSSIQRSGSNSAQIRSAGMSICSTSSEPGLPTDTISLGSMTASPADFTSGDLSNG